MEDSKMQVVTSAATPIQGSDARLVTVEQQTSYLLHRVHELEGELAHVLSLLFLPPPPPPSVQ
ncbi:hypothetical protein Hanom_Chr05g00419771 [Helianthus anomalus]